MGGPRLLPALLLAALVVQSSALRLPWREGAGAKGCGGDPHMVGSVVLTESGGYQVTSEPDGGPGGGTAALQGAAARRGQGRRGRRPATHMHTPAVPEPPPPPPPAGGVAWGSFLDGAETPSNFGQLRINTSGDYGDEQQL